MFLPVAGDLNIVPFRDYLGLHFGEELDPLFRDKVQVDLSSETSTSLGIQWLFQLDLRDGAIFAVKLIENFNNSQSSVSSVEAWCLAHHMIESGNKSEDDEIDWTEAVMETERRLISTSNGYNKAGNIVYDIIRMVARIHENHERYKKFQNVRTVLQYFVLSRFLKGRSVVLNHEEAPLAEASVGRIMEDGKTMKTVLDEPFVWRAAVNYFQQNDPEFHDTIRGSLSFPQAASDLGHRWEDMVLFSLKHAFHDRILSESALIPCLPPVFAFDGKNAAPVSIGTKSVLYEVDDVLGTRAKIVGLDEHGLGIDYYRMSLGEFLEAHVKNGSRSSRDRTQVPAFYFPAENPSGPDIVFVLQFETGGFCPVFVQMKLCTSLKNDEVKKAFTTVMARAVQVHLKDAKLETFCTVSPKLFLSVVAAYPARLPESVENLFFRPVTRSQSKRAKPERGLHCVLLKVDAGNIRDVFPEKHVELLDCLKSVKRKLENVRSDAVGELVRKKKKPRL
ncbi:hypothetical protein DFQ26_009943 [Actinomortierella ambigua]|nr:hypothetical protein DFQ26_009943 [Actinomortierella ambigua]